MAEAGEVNKLVFNDKLFARLESKEGALAWLDALLERGIRKGALTVSGSYLEFNYIHGRVTRAAMLESGLVEFAKLKQPTPLTARAKSGSTNLSRIKEIREGHWPENKLG